MHVLLNKSHNRAEKLLLLNFSRRFSEMHYQHCFSFPVHADINNHTEFYDFLQVNSSSNETNFCSSIDQQEENEANPSDGIQFIDFMEVGSSS
jgi:hypothetical protein